MSDTRGGSLCIQTSDEKLAVSTRKTFRKQAHAKNHWTIDLQICP